MADKDDILAENYGPRQAQDQQRRHYVEMRPEDKQAVTETYAPKWGRYIPDAARAFLLEAPRALMAVSPRAAPLPPASAAAGPLVPSIKVNGQVYTRGPTHSQALEAYAETLGKPAWDVDLTKGVIDGFTTPDGRFMNRLQAAKYVGVPTRTDYAKYGLESERGRELGVVKADGGGLIEDAYGPNTGSTSEFLTQYEHSSPLEPYNAARNVADTHKQEGAWGVAKRIANAWAQGGAGLIGSMIKTPLYDAPKAILEDYRPGAENEVVNQDIGKHAFDAGSVIMGGSVAPRPAGSLGTFAGVKSKTADLAALEKAKELQARGFGRDSIWKDTGWGQAPSGHWYYEIDDSKAVYSPGAFDQKIVDARSHYMPPQEARAQIRAQGTTGGTTKDVLDHPELYAAYPELADAPWTALPPDKLRLPGYGGVWRGLEKGAEINNTISPRLESGKSITLHETAGHGVQDIEGWPKGGNAEAFKDQEAAQRAREALSWRREIKRHVEEFPDPMEMKARDDAIIKQYQDMGAPDMVPSYSARRMAWMHDRYPDPGLQDLVHTYGLDQRTSPYTGAEVYHNLEGEVGPRNIQKREAMDRLQRRVTPPWKTQDVPDELQISKPNLDYYKNHPSTADILEQYGAKPIDPRMDPRLEQAAQLTDAPGRQRPFEAAMRVQLSNGEIKTYTGANHGIAYQNAVDELGETAVGQGTAALYDKKWVDAGMPFGTDPVSGFVGPDGYLTRAQASKQLKQQGVKVPRSLTAEDLDDMREAAQLKDREADYKKERDALMDKYKNKGGDGTLTAGGNRKAAAGVAAKDILEQYGAGAPQFDLGRGRGEHVVRTDNGSISYTPPIGDEVIITNIATNEGARGQGHAGRLLDGFLAQADQAGLKVTLEAGATQRGGLRNRDLVDFYQSRGFQLVDPQTNLMTREPAAGVAAGLMKPTLTAGGNREAAAGVAAKDILEQNYALPMDEASKAARGKEMGIDMDRTWYRGSALPPQESLKPGTQGHHFGDDPDALFFSSSPEVASEYARSHALYNGMDRHQAEYAAAKAAHDARPRTPIRDFFYGRKPFRHDGTTDFYEGANVAPVHVAPGRQGVIDAGIGRAPDGGNEHINIRAELKKMKAQGYDTVLVRNSADVSGPASRNGYPDELVVFPKDGEYRGIRSPTADFDPAKASSPNLLAAGGNRKAAAGVAAKDILEQYGAKPTPGAQFAGDRAWYHGTNAEDVGHFHPGKSGEGSGLDTGAVWFSDAHGSAADFGDNIVQANLKLRNPLVLDNPSWTRDNIPKYIQQARAGGHDGLIAKNVRDGAYTSNLAAVFDNTGIHKVETTPAWDGRIETPAQAAARERAFAEWSGELDRLYGKP